MPDCYRLLCALSVHQGYNIVIIIKILMNITLDQMRDAVLIPIVISRNEPTLDITVEVGSLTDLIL